MPRKTIELPLAVAKAFVRDMRAFHAEKTPGGEIDANIELLKADLYAVALRMKAALRKRQSEPLRIG